MTTLLTPRAIAARLSVSLSLGMGIYPPSTPWGINFGGGLNSTAMIIECRRRGLNPDWILFADTGSEMPGTLDHVERMREWCTGWAELTIVRWIKKDGSFEALHDHCLRTNYLPSKAYGYAGCTSKWKIAPMEKWRKQHGFDVGAFAIGYDAGERKRIASACQRGDDPKMTAWYPLVAWGIDRNGCEEIAQSEGMNIGKSSCFMCPNLSRIEWESLRINHNDLFDVAMKIESNAASNGNMRGKLHWPMLIASEDYREKQGILFDDFIVNDRCHHGGCFT